HELWTAAINERVRRPGPIASTASRDIDERRLGSAAATSGCASRYARLPGQPLRETEVVAIETGHVLAGDDGQAAVERGCETDVRLVHQETNARVAIALNDVARTIGGGIDDDEQLEIREGLCQNGVDRRAEKRLVVVRRQQNSHARRHAATLPRRARTHGQSKQPCAREPL